MQWRMVRGREVGAAGINNLLRTRGHVVLIYALGSAAHANVVYGVAYPKPPRLPVLQVMEPATGTYREPPIEDYRETEAVLVAWPKSAGPGLRNACGMPWTPNGGRGRRPFVRASDRDPVHGRGRARCSGGLDEAAVDDEVRAVDVGGARGGEHRYQGGDLAWGGEAAGGDGRGHLLADCVGAAAGRGSDRGGDAVRTEPQVG